jgi:hypothetical protein
MKTKNYNIRTEPLREFDAKRIQLFERMTEDDGSIVDLTAKAIDEGLFPKRVTELWDALVLRAKKHAGLKLSELLEQDYRSDFLNELMKTDDAPEMLVFFLDGLLPRRESIRQVYNLLLDQAMNGRNEDYVDDPEMKFFRSWIDKVTDAAKRERLTRLNLDAVKAYGKYQDLTEKMIRQHKELPWDLPSAPVMLLRLSDIGEGNVRVHAYDPLIPLPLTDSFLNITMSGGGFLNVRVDTSYDKKEILLSLDDVIDRAQRVSGKNPPKGRIDARTIVLTDLIESYFIEYYVRQSLSKEKSIEQTRKRLEEIGITLSPSGIEKRHLRPIMRRRGIRSLKELRKH